MTKVKMIFYSSGGCEWGHLGRVAYGGGADSMLPFWLERGSDGTKYCQKMKRSQGACLGSMGRKHDAMRQRGGEREEMTPLELA
jgi:hypothetical protein